MLFESILVAAAVAAAMEAVAWAEHKYVMHGFLWVLHRDHHQSSGKRLQKNDLFAFFFAVPSFLLIYSGLGRGSHIMASAGFGLALYGVGYVIFHDIMFHKRIRGIRIKTGHPYLKGIINAHSLHHSRAAKENGISFGFLWAPKKYAGPR